MGVDKKVFLGLVHYPVYNKNGEIVATSVTNLDIHDIARCASTYDIAAYYIIHPHPSQRQVVGELLAFWQEGFGATYNPDRKEALARLEMVETLAQAEADIRAKTGGGVIKVVTDARALPQSIGYSALRRQMQRPGEESYFLLFGTGYGLAEEVMAGAHLVLAPIVGRGPYNHLSVRSAAAIILDRLLGPAWWKEEEFCDDFADGAPDSAAF